MGAPGAVRAFAVAGAAVAWVVHLGVSYALVPHVCDTGATWILHLLTAGTALVATLSVVVARGLLRGPRHEGDGVGVDGFLGRWGVLAGAFFLLLILVGGLPAAMQNDPCSIIPTLDRPIIQLDAPAPLLAHPGGVVRPGEVWSSWRPDPWVLGILGLLGLGYLRGVRRLWQQAGRGRGIRPWRSWVYLAGLLALFLALGSPLELLAGALFSAHMAQHVLLLVVAPPLLVLGRPFTAWAWALPAGGRQWVAGAWRRLLPPRGARSILLHPATILALHMVTLWTWHLPVLYEAALRHPIVHHLEHASFFFPAILFWEALAGTRGLGGRAAHGAGILYVLATGLQGGALGALLLWAPRPWYPTHASGAELWGRDPLHDQQVAAAIMWMPVGLVYACAGVLLLVAWLRASDRAVTRREEGGWTLPPSAARSSSPDPS